MPTAPRDFAAALQYAQAQHVRPSTDWEGYCQKFVRLCYGIPMLFGSAYAQWLGAKPEHKHVGGKPGNAPLGAALFYKGAGPFGHVMLAARPFPSGRPAAWSNDLLRTGKIDKVHRVAPEIRWEQRYLGYTTAINHYSLPLQPKPVPKPKPKQVPYAAIEDAIEDLQKALETAVRQRDKADVVVLTAEISRLKRLHATLRRNA